VKWLQRAKAPKLSEVFMTILNDSMTRSHGRRPDPSIDDVVKATSDSNHATALTAWIIVTIAMGLVIQTGSVHAALATKWAMPMVIGLVFIAIGVGRAGTLLHNAALNMRLAHREALRLAGDAESPLDAWRGTETLLAGTTVRDILARRALRYAYGCGAAFAIWTIAVTLLLHG
jgi:hypothetical protein